MRAFRILASLLVLTTTACGSADEKKSEATPQLPPSQTRATSSMHANVQPGYRVEQPATSDPVEEEVEQEAIPEEPTSLSGFMRRGRKRFRAGELSLALSDYQAALAKAPRALQPNISLARTHLAMGDASSARPPAELAIDIDGTSSFAWNTLGRVELIEADFEAAIVSFERAVEEDEDNSYAWNNLGFAYIETGSFTRAVDALEHATSGSRPTPYMWNNLGMAYEHQDRIVEARASYRLAAEDGSTKAQLNFDRLEGVISLIPEIRD
ncbi:MAG: tetratricopeptide repeat protein, partial [Kofleriaceae bacterium]|nr:tetratricopeptide repeat protein [Kofleriaceae bacterium]